MRTSFRCLPLSFIERAAFVYPNHVAVIHGDWQITWKQCYERCRRLASALKKRGIGVGDTVALMAPNVPAMYEAHFAVPMIGAVLNTLNLRLDRGSPRLSCCSMAKPRSLITDREYSRNHRTCSANARRAAVGDRHR